jgi:dolichyl-phosphate beta-glucosyltransferase
MSRVTIVVPCFNEAQRLHIDAFLAFAQPRRNIRFLFVDDGSTDATAQIIDHLANTNPDHVSTLTLASNRGKGEAVRMGVLDALAYAPDYVGFWDADLATPLTDIDLFIRVLDEEPEREMVLGSRVQLLGRNIEHTQMRHYAGRIMANLASSLLGLRVYDTQCGAKLFRVTDRLAGLFEDPFITRWLFDVELLYRWVQQHGPVDPRLLETKIVEVPLRKWENSEGSKVKITDMIRAPFDLARIRRHYARMDSF